jgi:hypothetical protein
LARASVVQELPAAKRKLLITDGVFSMDSDPRCRATTLAGGSTAS